MLTATQTPFLSAYTIERLRRYFASMPRPEVRPNFIGSQEVRHA